ncbi:MAG: hypothetical protein IIC06_08540, partial [Proteobacteria bacterium]|nr:hypothetical protein [Pseudomonadota bacterium]
MAGKKNRDGRTSVPGFRLNPVRQAAFVCLALAGIAIGYGAGYWVKGDPPPASQEATDAPETQHSTKPVPTAPKTGTGISSRPRPPATAPTTAPPLLPEKEIAQQAGPLRAYEEALPEDIIDDPD